MSKRKTCQLFLALTLLLSSCGSPVRMPEDRFVQADKVWDRAAGLMTSNPDSAFALLRDARAASQDGTVARYLDALKAKCHYLAVQDDSCKLVTAAVSDWFDSLEAPESDACYVQGVSLNVRGVCLQVENNLDEAEECFERAVSCLERSGRGECLSDVYVNLSNVLLHQGNFASAAAAAGRALQCADSLGHDDSKHSIYVALAEIYARMANYAEAGRHFGLASEKYPPSTDYETFYLNNALCNFWFMQKEYSRALDASRKALSAARKTGQRPVMAIVEANLGDIFINMGQLDSARLWLDRAGEWFRKPGADDAARFYLDGLYASMYLQKGDISTARSYLSRPYDESRISPSYMYEHYRRLAVYFRRSGDWRRALLYSDKEREYDDSLRNLQYLNAVAEISARYSRDTTLIRQRAELVSSRETIRGQRLTIVVIVLVFALVCGAFAAVSSVLRRRRERQRREQLQLVRELRLQSARKLLSPHLLFNALNAVAPKDSSAAEHLVNIARFSVSMLDRNMIPLEDEIRMTKEYVALRRCLHPEDTPVVWDVSPDVDVGVCVPTLSIQTHVENALKYAGASEVDVTVRQVGTGLEIRVCDDGAGYLNSVSRPGQGTGKGILTMSRTIAALNEGRKNRILYEILSEKGNPGTEVRVTIPDEEDKNHNNR